MAGSKAFAQMGDVKSGDDGGMNYLSRLPRRIVTMPVAALET